MVTIKEIAQQLGVSPTTVSNVLNGRTGKMSPETRQKVQEALIQNHYVHESRHGDEEPVTHYVAVYCCPGRQGTYPDGSLLWRASGSRGAGIEKVWPHHGMRSCRRKCGF